MIRPLALIGTTGLLLITVTAATADDGSQTAAVVPAAASCDSCRNGTNGWTYGPAVYYGPACPDCSRCGHNGCMSQLCASKGWPDKGWNPPAQYPVNRDGIWYHNMWPQAWYGNPGGGFRANAPMVYQPTDTTQLGYSYAKVPTWQAIRMVPPTPCPEQFHARVCVPHPHAGRLFDGCPSGNPCRNGSGSCMHGAGGNCPSCRRMPAAAAPALGPAETPAPVPQPEPVPSASPQTGTSSGSFPFALAVPSSDASAAGSIEQTAHTAADDSPTSPPMPRTAPSGVRLRPKARPGLLDRLGLNRLFD